MELTSIQTLAIAKMPKNTLDKARKNVKPGNYPIDFTVKVTGNVSVANDTSKLPTVAIPYKAVIGLLLQRAGCTREASKQLLLDVMQQALNAGKNADEVFKEQVQTVEESIEKLSKEIIEKLPKIPVNGAVDVDVTFDVCEKNKQRKAA